MTTINTKITKKKVPVDYTKKGFEEIKEDLKSYIKTYYPDTYQDFSKSSFGSMMFDLVSYVGDQLHYYIDHNANEANPMFSKEVSNVFQHITAIGGQPETTVSTFGLVDLYLPIPAKSIGIGVDTSYNFVIHAGSTYRTQGGNVFTQMEDVSVNLANSEIIGHKTNTDGSKLSYYLLKAKIPIISGEVKDFVVEVGEYRKFLKIEIPDSGVTEIIKVLDSEKREYYRVDNLTQDTIYKSVVDPSMSQDSPVRVRLKAQPVPRRFIKQTDLDRAFIHFGYGSGGDETTNSLVDPSKLVLKRAGGEYISSPKQNPYNILTSNALGIAPQNTTLTITYRSNSNFNSNAAAGTINQVLNPIMSFNNEHLLDEAKVSYIRDNIQIFNEQPINGHVTISNTEELKKRHLGNYSSQGRAVTKQDYISAIYSMPSHFGAIKRAAVVRDDNDLTRNLNIYLISESAAGKMETPSLIVKQNLKTWIDSMKMISDSVDLFDAHIINLALDLKFQVSPSSNPQTLLTEVKRKIYDELMNISPDIGEPFYITEVYRILRSIPEVVSVPQRDGVIVRNVVGGNRYSSNSYDIRYNMSTDESVIYVPQDSIWEIKFLDDIRGTVTK